MAKKKKPDQKFVKYYQGLLTAHGHAVEQTGISDAATQAAARDFQVKYGLNPTGTATRETIDALKQIRPGALPGESRPPGGLRRPVDETMAATLAPAQPYEQDPYANAAGAWEAAGDMPTNYEVSDEADRIDAGFDAHEAPPEQQPDDFSEFGDRMAANAAAHPNVANMLRQMQEETRTGNLQFQLDKKARAAPPVPIEMSRANSPFAAGAESFDTADRETSFINRWNNYEGDIALDNMLMPELEAAIAKKRKMDEKAGMVPGPQSLLIGDVWKTVKSVASGLNPIGSAQAAEKGPLDKAIEEQAGGAPQPEPDALDEVLGITPVRKAPEAPAPEGGLGETAKTVAKDVGTGLALSGGEMVRGARNAVQSMLDLMDPAGDFLASKLGEPQFYDKDGNFDLKWLSGKDVDLSKSGIGLPEIKGSGTVTGGAISGITQFLVGFAIGGKILQGVGWAAETGGPILQGARELVKGAISDGVFFDGMSGRLADLLKEVPGLKGPITDYLSTDPNDSMAEARFKNAIEGMGFGLVAPLFVKAVQALKYWRASKAVPAKTELTLATKGEPATREAQPMTLLGDENLPPIVDRGTAQKITQFGDDVDVGVPDDLVAKALTDKGLSPLPIGNQGRVGFVNWSGFKTGDDIQRVANDFAAAFEEDIDAARRGVIPHAQTRADAASIPAWQVMMDRQAGQAHNAAEIHAFKTLYEGALTKVQEVGRLASATPTPENLAQLRQMIGITTAIQKQFYGARAEAGRALNAFRIVGTAGERSKQLETLLAQNGGMDTSLEIAKRLASLSDPDAIDQFVQKVSIGGKTAAAVKDIWYFSLLSNPKTHVVNVMSNALVMGLSVAEKAVAARITRLFGGTEGVEFGEAMAEWYGMKAAMGDAFRMAGKALREGTTDPGKLDQIPPRGISSEMWGLRKDSVFGKAVDGLGFLTGTPTRLLMSEDEWFKTVIRSKSYYGQAYRQVSKEITDGVTPRAEAGNRIAAIVSNPTEAMRLQADQDAKYLTFTSDPGRITKRILGLRSEVPGARFVVPFVNVAANIFNYTAERAGPLGMLTARYKAAIAKGGAEADMARSKIMLGTFLMSIAADWAMDGRLTGSGPTDPAQRANWLRQGNRPYSVKVGDTWVSFNRTDPVGNFLAMGGELGEYLGNNEMTDDEDANYERAVAAAIFGISDTVASKTFLSGASNLVEAMNNPDQYGESYVRSLVSTLAVPGIAKFIKDVSDPTQRMTSSMGEAIKSRLPGLSETLPPNRDAWGRERTYATGLGGVANAMLPFQTSTYKPEPIDREMEAQGWYIGMPPKSFVIDKMKVSLRDRPDVYSEFLKLRGQTKPSDMPKPPAVDNADIHVIDGDTFDFNGERIRVVGINTPELKRGGDLDRVLAGKSKEKLEALLKSGQISIDRRGTDKFGRTLGYVTVGGAGIAETMVGEGYGEDTSTKYRDTAVSISEKLKAKYGDVTMLEALNAIVKGEGEQGEKYQALNDADERESFVRKVIKDYQDAAKAVTLANNPWMTVKARAMNEAWKRRGVPLEEVQ